MGGWRGGCCGDDQRREGEPVGVQRGQATVAASHANPVLLAPNSNFGTSV